VAGKVIVRLVPLEAEADSRGSAAIRGCQIALTSTPPQIAAVVTASEIAAAPRAMHSITPSSSRNAKASSMITSAAAPFSA
jgi:hypothetical protein